MKKLISVEEAVAKVKDGMTVMIGGFLSNGTPNAIVNALAQSEVKNLILIVNDTAYPDKGCGQLIANKQVKKVIVSHIGTNPCTSEQMNSGDAQFNGQRHDELTGKSAVLGRLDFLHGVPELFPILPFLRGIFRQKHFLPDKSLLFCVVMLYPIVIIIQAGTA